MVAVPGVQAADVEIVTNISDGVDLDLRAGTTAHVAAGVTVDNTVNLRAGGYPGVSASTASWTLDNDGTITSTAFAPGRIVYFGAGGIINNSGTIIAPVTGRAIEMTAGGVVNNLIGGTISAGSSYSAVFIGSAAGTVTNAGTITGNVMLTGGGSVANQLGGGIAISTAGGVAVTVRGGTDRTLTNSGTIESTGSGYATGAEIGFAASGTATILNNSGGTIFGTYNGTYSGNTVLLNLTNHGRIASTNGPGIEANGGGIFINTGLVESANIAMRIAGSSASSVTNSGTIRSTGGGNAIVFSGSATHSLTLDTGSMLDGSVLGGTGTDELILSGSGAETITKFTNFETLKMTGSDWTLSGAGTFSVSSNIAAGTLRVAGTLTTPLLSVNSGGTLTGTGAITGAGSLVAIGNGGTLAGSQGQTLAMLNLALDAGAEINVALGAPGNTISLFAVAEDLVLDGTLNVTNAGGFGQGVYRIFDYGGALTDNGLDVGTMPAGTAGMVQTAIASQVNLVVSGSGGPGPIPSTQFWNGTTTAPTGTVVGGAGSWSAGPTTNWTDANGTRSDPWNDNFAVFQGSAGVVSVDMAGISTTGMQFAADGYRLEGGDISLTAPATIRVGNGSAGGAGYTATIANSLTGSGGLVKNDLGTLVLSGDSSLYAGPVTVAAGELRMDAGGSLGATLLTVQNGKLVVRNSGAVKSADGTIGDNAGSTGSITVEGTGSLFSAGLDLTVGDAGNGELTITNGATGRQGDDTPNLGSTYTYIGRQADAAGVVTVSGPGSEFNGMNIWLGGSGDGKFLVENGGVARGYFRLGAEAAGTGLLTVKGAASTVTVAPIDVGFRGKGRLEILDGGFVQGALAFIGSLASGEGEALVSGSGSRWQQSAFLSVGSFGKGSLTIADGGHVNSLAGGYIGEGAGSVGTVTVSGTGSLWETAGTLFVGTSGRGTLIISDDGVFRSNGPNQVIIAENAGSRGDLVVGTTPGSGRLEASRVVIGNGAGTISGLGTIFGDVSVAGGTLAPGASTLGALTVQGNVSFDATSAFVVRIAADGTNDALAATSADLAGQVAVTAIDAHRSYLDGQNYTILTTSANGVSGTFEGATMTTHSAFLKPTLTHNADNVVLTIAVTQDFGTVAETYNQLQAANALNDLEQTGDALAVFNTIANMNADDARRAFDLTSGEVHAAGQHVIDQTFALFNRTLRYQGVADIGPGNVGAQVFTAPLGYGPAVTASNAGVVAIEDAAAYADARMRGAWAAPLGGFGHIDGDGNAAQLDYWNAGLAAGYEGMIDVASGNAVGGFGFGYIHSRGTVHDRLSTFDAQGLYLGAYGAWTDGPWNVTGSLSYGANRVSTARNIAFMGTTAEASYWTHTIGTSGEASYAFDIADTTKIAPLFTFDAGWSGHGGFTERGAGALNLAAGSESWTRLDAGLGIALTHTILTETGNVTLEGRAVWEHAFADVVPSQSLAFAGSPTGFNVLGPDAGRDRLRIGAGLSWDISDDMTVRARYDGLFSRDQANHSASLGLNVRF